MPHVRRLVLITLALVTLAALPWVGTDSPARAAREGGSVEARVSAFPAQLVLEGDARQRGAAYGRQFAPAVRQFLDAEIYRPFEGRPTSRARLLEYAAACGRVVRDVCPMVAEEFEGIAAGAGVSFDEVVLINLHEELYHRTDLPKSGHCTAVAVGPPVTSGGRTYVGQTWDWMTSVAGKSRVTEWRRGADEGASVLAYGFPGMPTGAGLSSSGVALCWTSAALGEKGQAARVGLPSYALITHLLSQKDMDSVVREAERDRHAGWFTFVLADAEGNLVNIEGSPEGVAVERSNGSLLRVGYGSRKMTRTNDGQPVLLHGRCKTLAALLNASAGRTDLATLQRYLADPGHGISVGEGTIDLMVYDTASRTAHLSRGTAYGLAWHDFRFGGGG